MKSELVSSGAPVASYSRRNLPPDCIGNPFLEALDLFKQADEIIETLFSTVEVSPEIRQLPAETRDNLTRAVDQLFVPLPRDYELWRRLAKAITDSYLARTNNDPRYFSKLLNARTPVYFGARTFTSSLIILEGSSRAGKTASLHRFLQAIPSVIQHVQYKGEPFYTKQIPWIKLEFPESRADKDIPREIVSQLCTLLSLSQPSERSLTKGEFINSVARQFAVHGVGLLVLDDCEHLENYSEKERQGTFNFLFRLCATIGVAVVCVGTELLVDILASSEPLKNRSIRYPLPRWESLSDEDWSEFVQELWKIQYTSQFTPLTEKLSTRLREISGGLPGIAAPIFAEAQSIAIIRDGFDTGTEVISVEHLDAALSNVRFLNPSLPRASVESRLDSDDCARRRKTTNKTDLKVPTTVVKPDLAGRDLLAQLKAEMLAEGACVQSVLESFELQPPRDLLDYEQ